MFNEALRNRRTISLASGTIFRAVHLSHCVSAGIVDLARARSEECARLTTCVRHCIAARACYLQSAAHIKGTLPKLESKGRALAGRRGFAFVGLRPPGTFRLASESTTQIVSSGHRFFWEMVEGVPWSVDLHLLAVEWSIIMVVTLAVICRSGRQHRS